MQKAIIFAGMILFLATGLCVADEESLTITTYYPSPFGVYRELRSQRMAIGATYYDGSQYCWDDPVGSCPAGAIPIPNNIDLMVEGNVVGDNLRDKQCADDQYVVGFNANGEIICQEAGISLVSGDHTIEDCLAAGGNVANAGGELVCRLDGSECPGDWTEYGSWSVGTHEYCCGGCVLRMLGYMCPRSCCTATWAWADQSSASCLYTSSTTRAAGRIVVCVTTNSTCTNTVMAARACY